MNAERFRLTAPKGPLSYINNSPDTPHSRRPEVINFTKQSRYLTDINNISRNTGLYMVRYVLIVGPAHNQKQSYDLRSPPVVPKVHTHTCTACALGHEQYKYLVLLLDETPPVRGVCPPGGKKTVSSGKKTSATPNHDSPWAVIHTITTHPFHRAACSGPETTAPEKSAPHRAVRLAL